MTDIREVRASIEARLKELGKEQAALEGALSALSGVAGAARRGPGRPRGSGRGGQRRGARKRGRRGSRAGEALALVKAQPGVTIPAMAKQMGIAPPYLYRVLPKLAEEGKVKKDGSGWHPA
jgi:hypothetical protein